MNYEIRQVDNPSDELTHHGILGQRWGIRRFQNKDGSLTSEGRKRYGTLSENLSKWKEKAVATGHRVSGTVSDWKKQIRAKATADKIARDARKQAKDESNEQKKRELIERGSPDQIKKNIRMFNDAELGEIQQRFDKELKVRDQVEKIINYGQTPKTNGTPNGLTGITVNRKKLSDAMQFVSNTTKQSASSVNDAIKTYNGIAYAYNALSGTHSPMTIIPTKEERQNNPSGGGS